MTEPDSAPPKLKLVGAVVQAVRLLQVLDRSEKPLGVSALAREAKINPSTAFNILRTLAVEKLVSFDELSKTYSLGGGLLTLSRKLLGRSLIADIRPELDRLARETACLVGIWQATPDRMVLVERAVSDRPMRLDMPIKQRLPLMIGAIGRAMAAHQHLTGNDLRRVFDNLHWEGPIDFPIYEAQVEDARRTGYGVDAETLYPGIVSVAAIIPGASGRPLYGLTASDLAGRLEGDHIREVGEKMVAVAHAFTS